MSSTQNKNSYRKSNAKHWCELCKIFVFNNKACISKHESTQQHKTNLELKINESIYDSQSRNHASKIEGKRKETPLYNFRKSEKSRPYLKESAAPVQWKCTSAAINGSVKNSKNHASDVQQTETTSKNFESISIKIESAKRTKLSSSASIAFEEE